jgi:cytochrome c peroxidase
MKTGNKPLWCTRHPFLSFAVVVALLAAGLLSMDARIAVGGGDMAPLNTVPAPVRVGGDIVDNAAAIRLGKALFWDTQVGGDGQIACATCHFHSGADNRTFNTLNPGPDGIFASGGVTAAGQNFHPSNIVNDDRLGSQGIVGSIYLGYDHVNLANAVDICTPDETAPFFHNRRVTGRNTPTVIGAVFNRQNFWDGRANDKFNGLNPFGLTGNAAAAGGSLGRTVTNSSLASQTVGPPNNPVEMSCAGRPFNGENSLATKLIPRQPLQHQRVHPQDSVLGGLSNWPNNGLSRSYTQLISDAFGPAVAANAANTFSRIWGQAIQAYLSTLIPDQTPLDRFLAGDSKAMTSSQQKGLNIFGGKGGCTKCHAGAELTDASMSFAAQRGLVNEDGGDQGFHNNGVRPTAEDLGRAGAGPGGVSFSESGSPMDHGAFKTPGLRNVKLTAPYFNNGGKATLTDVVDFYSRGGDFDNPEKAKRIQPRNFKSEETAALVDFLTNGLTDCRVEREEAPFDHPSISVPNGPSVPATGGGHSCR